jgi:hypothetical protein
MNTRQIGDISESMVTARFLKEGWQVFTPVNSNGRIDLLLERGSGFERIQVKTARLKNGDIFFSARSKDLATNKSKGYFGEIDSFAVYSPDLDEVYLIPIEENMEWDIRLRLDLSRTSNHVLKSADDYLVGPKSSSRGQITYFSGDELTEQFIVDNRYDIEADGTPVSISRDGNRKKIGSLNIGRPTITYGKMNLRVNRLVYRKFIGPLIPWSRIVHLDGNPLNCNPSNLVQKISRRKKSKLQKTK